MERRSQWLRGVLDLCVLAVLADGPRHGYDVAGRLGSAGLGRIPGGTLYPVLSRLAQAGLLEASWQSGRHGPARKYYALTAAGREFLAEVSPDWLAFASTVSALLEPDTTTRSDDAHRSVPAQARRGAGGEGDGRGPGP